MGFSDSARASIQMTHSANGPTVSFEEAQRIERETANHLLLSRKLSLIVDLDQTIVHATVDPTVGEWIAEGEAWEARQAKLTAAPTQNGSSAGTDSTISDSDDEVNPNWEALKDVRKFKLGPEALGQHDHHHGPRRKPKNKSVENEGCMYYIKPRYDLIHFPIRTEVLISLTPPMLSAAPVGKNSYGQLQLNTKCTFTLWELVRMPKRSVLL